MEAISQDGAAALGARFYQQASVVTHGDPDAAEMRTTPTGISIRPDDFALTTVLHTVLDATHRFQRAVSGQDWKPSMDLQMIQVLAIHLLNGLSAHQPDS